ncbi:MAG: radical SAM family heme chaperone HemW [Alphaproteobacteria bacterium]
MATAPERTAPASAADDAGFGVYVHWPFCASKCPYCDFNSHVRAAVDEVRWRAGLIAEIDHFAALIPGCTVTSVFFGGGTPSLMAPETVAALIERIAHRWRLAGDAEITLEANPTSVEACRFAGYRAAGVNRVSLGVQSLNDDALRFLGRGHSAAEARAAVETARARFPRLSFDLIYARPGQSVAAWRAELDQALALAADHLSLYQLTLEPGTAFHARARRGELVLPADDDAAALYDATQAACEGAGLAAYEVSNHAAPGAESRHNLTYWRGGDYVGVGPGAHGRLSVDGGTVATRQIRAPERWLAETERAGHGTRESVPVSEDERTAEVLMMGLRLTEGVSRERFRARTGRPLDEALTRERLDPLIDGGFVGVDAAGLRVTPAGRRVLDAVIAALLP